MNRTNNFPLVSIEKLAMALEKSHDGIIISDPRGDVLYSTPSADFSIIPHSFRNQNVQDMVREGIFSHSVIWDATRQKKPITKAIRTKSGAFVVSTATPLLDDKDNVILVITNVRDDNKLESYATALREANSHVERYKNVIKYMQDAKSNSNQIITQCPRMLQTMEFLRRAAAKDSTVLITGESGTGKELMSSLVHENSTRRAEPFIPVNCAALPKELVESEFFGYEKGAFSGASAKGKPGFFELAHRGTLFLDEVAEMPLDLQSKFLRVLETGSFLRLGGTTMVHTNVRIIAATNRNLSQCVEAGTFRADLYYRLNVIPAHIPPLRDRGNDIIYLAEYFLDRANIRYSTGHTLSSTMKAALMAYNWPGNVRELKNFIERYAIMPDNEGLLIESIPTDKINRQKKSPVPLPGYHGESDRTLKEITRETEIAYIKQVLTACNGNVTLSAKKLGIHRSMLHRKIQDYHIDY